MTTLYRPFRAGTPVETEDKRIKKSRTGAARCQSGSEGGKTLVRGYATSV